MSTKSYIHRFALYAVPIGAALAAIQFLGVQFPADPWRLLVIGAALEVGYGYAHRWSQS